MTSASGAGGGRVQWRWQEKDFGFRFRSGSGRREAEYYQASQPGEFYVVPNSQRKLEKTHADDLEKAFPATTIAETNSESTHQLCKWKQLNINHEGNFSKFFVESTKLFASSIYLI